MFPSSSAAGVASQSEQPVSQVLSQPHFGLQQRNRVRSRGRLQQLVGQQAVSVAAVSQQVGAGVQQGFTVLQQVVSVLQQEVRTRNNLGPQQDLTTGLQQRVFMRQNN